MTSSEPAVDISITIGAGRKGDPLRLRNPVIAASGTLGTGTEVQRDINLAALGAIVTPGIARRARNPRPAIPLVETPAGLFLAGAYPTLSIRSVVGRYAPRWATWPAPVIANLPADDADACVATAAMLADHIGVAAIELGLVPIASHLTDDGSARDLQHLCRQLSDNWPRPLLVKLPYGLPNLRTLVEAAAEGGADAVVLGGGFPARAVDRDRSIAPDRLLAGRVVGPATRPLALDAVAAICATTRLPVIASGGIASGADALAFLVAGARAVQVGSASLRHPAAAITVARDLDELVQPRGFAGVQDFNGGPKPEASPP